MKPHVLLTLLAAALVVLVLPARTSAHLEPTAGLSWTGVTEEDADGTDAEAEDADHEHADDEDAAPVDLEEEGDLAVGAGAVHVATEHGVVTCSLQTSVDLTAFAGQNVVIRCELISGVWVVTKIKSHDGEAEIEIEHVHPDEPGDADELEDHEHGDTVDSTADDHEHGDTGDTAEDHEHGDTGDTAEDDHSHDDEAADHDHDESSAGTDEDDHEHPDQDDDHYDG